MNSNTNTDLLKKVFRVDAVFCALMALDLVLFHDWIAGLMGQIPAQLWLFLGGGLALWAADLALLSWRDSWLCRFTRVVIVLDWAWVVITMGLLVLFFERFSVLGVASLLFCNLVVIGMALTKHKGLRMALV